MNNKYIEIYRLGCAWKGDNSAVTWSDATTNDGDTSCLNTANDYIRGLLETKNAVDTATSYDAEELALNGNGTPDDGNEFGVNDTYATAKSDSAYYTAQKEIADANLLVLTNARDALQVTIDVLNVDAGTVKGSEQIELTRLEVLKTQA